MSEFFRARALIFNFFSTECLVLLSLSSHSRLRGVKKTISSRLQAQWTFLWSPRFSSSPWHTGVGSRSLLWLPCYTKFSRSFAIYSPSRRCWKPKWFPLRRTKLNIGCMVVNEKRVFVSSLYLKTCISTDTAATVFCQCAATPEKKYTSRGFLWSNLPLPMLYSISVFFWCKKSTLSHAL